MLSKEVCIKCWTKTVTGWEGSDEIRWATGVVLCPYSGKKALNETTINEPPPEWCPKKFEHAVAFKDCGDGRR